MKGIKFNYVFEEDKVADFINAVLPYSQNLVISKTRYADGTVKPKSSMVRNGIFEKEVIQYLVDNKESSTNKIYRRVRSKGYSYSIRTFYRTLINMGCLGILGVRKAKKTGGGFENLWRIENELLCY